MTRTRILILSASAGNGHTRAAEALCAQVRAAHGDAALDHVDALQLVSPLLRFAYTRAYMLLVRHAPGLWRWLYDASDRAAAGQAFGRLLPWLHRCNAGRLVAEVARLQPDVVICTHFLPAELLAAQAGTSPRVPLWVQVTDFDLHGSWVHEHITGYFAPNKEVAWRLRGHGVAAERIFTTGIPTMPGFARPPARADCAREAGLLPQRFTVLLLGAGRGVGSLACMAAGLLEACPQVQVLALAGRDQAALAALQQLQARFPGRLATSGHTRTMERLMACADVIVTKPGGLTTAEALAMGVPMIVIAPIPGQEEHNANYLLEYGAALRAFDLPTLVYRVGTLIAQPATLAAMRGAARSLGRADAAASILTIILRRHCP